MMSRSSRDLGVLLFALGAVGCAKPGPTPPEPTRDQVPPRARDEGGQAEALWTRMQTDLTWGNREAWFASLPDDPATVSAALLKLLDQSVGSCTQWVTETCDDHHHGDPVEPDEDAGIDDECAALRIFLDQTARITAADRKAHADSLALLPAADLGQAKALLAVALELAPFETAAEVYALLAVHDRGTDGDDALREAIEALILAQPEGPRQLALRALAAQRDDPVAAMDAAQQLANAGEARFLPQWNADASLQDLAFLVHMVGSLGDTIPASFVSSEGLTVRTVAHADPGAVETFDPPRETVKELPWAADREYPAPWVDVDHLDPTAKRTRCTDDGPQPQCISKRDGFVTTVVFDRAGGGFKVRAVTTEIDFPDCML